MIHNSRLFSFVLVSKVRSCVHIIKLPNPISKLIILKIIILIDSEIKSKFRSRQRSCFTVIRYLCASAVFEQPSPLLWLAKS
jgi:hypothetical protein